MRRLVTLVSRLAVPLGASLALMLGCISAPATPKPPSNLVYPEAGVGGIVGQPIPTITPTVGGQVDRFSISPDLPPGLLLDNRTGAIRGTPTLPWGKLHTVTASNAAGFVTAKVQVAIAGFVPDLRFQWTGAFDTYRQSPGSLTLGTPPEGSQGILNTCSGIIHWGPLQISSPTGDGWSCGWFGTGLPLVGGTESIYTVDHLEVMEERLKEFTGQGMVITSLDLSMRGFGLVATGPTGDALEYATVRTTVASLEALSAWASAQGQRGAVLTALATPGKTYTNDPGSGQVLAFAATRRSDAGTYEAVLVSGTPDELALRLPDLGQQGYVVTAFGAGDQEAYIAVLTRPAGVTTPHTIAVGGDADLQAASFENGFVRVGWMSDLGGANPRFVFQR